MNKDYSSQYGVGPVPYHVHNGTDSPILPSYITTGSGNPFFRASQGTLYINIAPTSGTNRLFINTTGGTTWAYFTTSS